MESGSKVPPSNSLNISADFSFLSLSLSLCIYIIIYMYIYMRVVHLVTEGPHNYAKKVSTHNLQTPAH